MAYFRRTIVNGQPPIPPTPPYTPPTPPEPPTPESGTTPDTPRPTHQGSTTVKLYDNYSDNNVLNKNIEIFETVSNVALKRDTSVSNPRIIIKTNKDITKCNYCYVSSLSRYYYIDDIICLKPMYYELVLRVDVLMSFNNYINNLQGILEYVTPDENQLLYNKYFANDHYELVTEQTIIYDGGTSKKGILEPNSAEWILATIGKISGDEQ